MSKTKKTADVVVVGSGPGGATVARELTRQGRNKRVIICESGRYHKLFGYFPLTFFQMDKLGMTFSKEWTWVLKPKTVGGASFVFYGCAVKPPQWFKDKYGIDLSAEVDELYKEIPIAPLPDHLIGTAARRIMEEAQGIGLDWKPIDKFIRPDKCELGCGGCGLGCKKDAKWTAREFVEEAKANGAELLVNTKVDRVLIENGKAVGVRAKGPDGWQDIFADTVVLSAGGMANPGILNRSGIFDAGKGFFADPLWRVIGASD
jgi:choline dehydrogenase-like flavoprotein